MINDGGKEGFGEKHELVGVEGVNGVCDEKAGGFSGGLVKNEDEKSRIKCSHGVLFAGKGAESDGGLAFGFNEGFGSELECENVRDVTENGLLSIEVVANNVAQGGDDETECGHEVKNDALVNLSAVVEVDGERCVNAKESLHLEDFSRNCVGLEPSQPAFQVDAQIDVMQNHAMVVDIDEGRMFENIQSEDHGFNLVVDLNSYRNIREVSVCRKPTNSELNFSVSDLVWGKVTGHPWWPGQICDASAASEKAKRHLKEHCYLIAYFGDHSFAWNDVSMIKPFQMHFSQMEKQSNLEDFHFAVDCALDEVSRRVQFSLSCPCIPRDVFSKLETQVISNAGVNKQLSRRNVGGDRFMNSMSFKPLKLVNFVKSLAESPLDESDRLDFVTSRAQLLAFYHYKGYSQLPEFTLLGGLYDNDMETLLMRGQEQCDYQTHVDYSKQEHNHISGGSKRRGRRHKLLSNLMYEKSLCVSNGEHTSEQISKSAPRRRGRKRKAPYHTSEDYFHNSQKRRFTLLQNASIDEMRTQLCLAAKDPIEESCTSDMVHFFAEFRNSISLDSSVSLDQVISIIFPETLTQANPHSFSTDLGFKQRDINVNFGSESSKLMEHLDESSKEDFCPTALTLKFTNLNSVPSTTDLNKIFGRFGPLIESKTELLEKSNRARVVFQRRPDAETAFSSAGKYSVFGPSLVSYRLKILPRKLPKGTGKRGRKRKNERSSVDAAL
uniref:Serine/threonine-protein kinase ATM n=1 Tax=Cajanus cajan TaxID=3821 RepID=A0A151SN26_CAJCA|nr:Serine/threonine-protein kinase ATM [Cajanus cajan]